MLSWAGIADTKKSPAQNAVYSPFRDSFIWKALEDSTSNK